MVLATDWPSVGIAAAALLWGAGWAIYTHRLNEARRRENIQQDRALEQLNRAKDQALEEIADQRKAIADLVGQAAAAGALSAAHAQGAQLSARLKDRGGNKYRLVVRNVGPDGAQLRVADVLGQDDVLVGSALEDGPVELLPGEELAIIAALTFGTTLPLEVHLRWVDGRGEQARVQVVTLA